MRLLAGQGGIIGALLCTSKALHSTLCHVEHFSCSQFQPWMLTILTRGSGVELNMHPNRQLLAHFVVHMPSCLHGLFCVACPLHSNRGCEGTVTWGMFPRGCEDTGKGGGGG